jgi:integrase/recombinase XerD
MKTSDVLNKYVSTHNLSFQTVRLLSSISKRLLIAFPDEYPTDAYSFNEFLINLTKTGLKPVSANLYCRWIKTINTFLKELIDYPDINSRIKRIKYIPEKRIYWTPETLALLVVTANDDIERILVSVLIDSLCRIGELASLKYDDIEPENERFKSYGKTGQQYHRCDSRLCNAMKTMSSSGQFVFPVSHRQDISNLSEAEIIYLRTGSLESKMRLLIKRAGLTGKKLSPHTIRHSSASMVAKITDNAFLTQSLLGHANPQTTQIYMHDVHDTIIQKVSPLQMVKDNISPQHSTQALLLPSGEPTNQTSNETIITNKVDEIIESSYPQITDSMKVRTQLNSDDLRLIRRAFICLSQFGQITTDSSDSRKLLKRFLRKEHSSTHIDEQALTPVP